MCFPVFPPPSKCACSAMQASVQEPLVWEPFSAERETSFPPDSPEDGVWALVLVPRGVVCVTLLRARGSSPPCSQASADVSWREGNQNEPQTQGPCA